MLVTLHRPALVDGPLLGEAMAAAAPSSAREMPVVFPVHPRTRKMLEAEVGDDAPGLLLIEPVGYLDFLSLMADAGAVLTDSGGIQEETTYLGVPCFTLRDNTERPVTIRAGHQHPARPRPGGDRDDPGGAGRAAGGAPPSRRRSGTGRPPSGSPRSSPRLRR